MRELPRVNIFEDFYMWFDLEEKKEHYATPLYLYQVERDRINPDDETKFYLKLKKDISKVKTGIDKEIIKHPATIYIHYVENLGAMLINFLNADFTNYETAYNTFFIATSPNPPISYFFFISSNELKSEYFLICSSLENTSKYKNAIFPSTFPGSSIFI